MKRRSYEMTRGLPLVRAADELADVLVESAKALKQSCICTDPAISEAALKAGLAEPADSGALLCLATDLRQDLEIGLELVVGASASARLGSRIRALEASLSQR